MTSEVVRRLASKRVIYLVCSSGQSSSSALMILCSSLLGENSCGVFWIRSKKYYYFWCYVCILGLGFQRAVYNREGQLVDGIHSY